MDPVRLWRHFSMCDGKLCDARLHGGYCTQVATAWFILPTSLWSDGPTSSSLDCLDLSSNDDWCIFPHFHMMSFKTHVGYISESVYCSSKQEAYIWIIEPAPSCCLTISATQNTSGFSITLKDAWPQGCTIEPRISRWAETPFPQHSVWLKYLRNVIILMYLCISMHSYIFSTCQDLLQEKVVWWTDEPPPSRYYDADIPSKWLLQVGNSHVHLSHCLYKCLLHCCSLMSPRKTSVSAWADIRWHPGLSCDQIMGRTMFPISPVEPFSISQGEEKPTCKQQHHA